MKACVSTGFYSGASATGQTLDAGVIVFLSGDVWLSCVCCNLCASCRVFMGLMVATTLLRKVLRVFRPTLPRPYFVAGSLLLTWGQCVGSSLSRDIQPAVRVRRWGFGGIDHGFSRPIVVDWRRPTTSRPGSLAGTLPDRASTTTLGVAKDAASWWKVADPGP